MSIFSLLSISNPSSCRSLPRSISRSIKAAASNALGKEDWGKEKWIYIDKRIEQATTDDLLFDLLFSHRLVDSVEMHTAYDFGIPLLMV
jgi:hypothetical protein